MKVFHIHTMIGGFNTIVEVQQPIPWDGNEFTIRYGSGAKKKVVILQFNNGHWKHIPYKLDQKQNLEDLEIDSIGHQIAIYWCQQLARQLHHFQLYI